MAFALPVWLTVHEELLGHDEDEFGSQSCFDEYDDEALFQMFHLTRSCLTFIRDSVCSRMSKASLRVTSRNSVDAMVTVALNFYAHGVSSAAILQRVGLSQTQSPGVISMVSGVIAGMSDQFISFPLNREAKDNVASKIEAFCGIPNVVGVLAPAHFKIRASPYEKANFRSFVNTLGYTSVVSQIICDPDGNILSVEKCCVGGTCEQEIWESSFRGRKVEEESHGPYRVIGGNGYRLSKHVLTPVLDPANDSEDRFNEAHAKIHSTMRTALGHIKRRFRCLMQLGFAQEGSLDKKSNIIKACCVLHNIAKKFSVPPPPAAGKIEDLHPGKQRSAVEEINSEALKARQELINSVFSVVPGHKERRRTGTQEDNV